MASRNEGKGFVMSCPRFESCNAPICPLDADCRQRTYLDGEPVCAFMLESVKPLGRLKIQGAIGGEGAGLVGEAVEWAFLSHSPIRKRLQRASRTPSRLGGGNGERE